MKRAIFGQFEPAFGQFPGGLAKLLVDLNQRDREE